MKKLRKDISIIIILLTVIIFAINNSFSQNNLNKNKEETDGWPTGFWLEFRIQDINTGSVCVAPSNMIDLCPGIYRIDVREGHEGEYKKRRTKFEFKLYCYNTAVLHIEKEFDMWDDPYEYFDEYFGRFNVIQDINLAEEGPYRGWFKIWQHHTGFGWREVCDNWSPIINVSFRKDIVTLNEQLDNTIPYTFIANQKINFLSGFKYKPDNGWGNPKLKGYIDNCNNKENSIVKIKTESFIKGNLNTVVFVFPNPTNGIINVNTIGEYQKIEVKDIYGKIIFQTDQVNSENQFDLSKYSKGLYFILLYKLNKEVEVNKIILN